MTDVQEYAATYYDFSRPTDGVKHRVDGWRDWVLRRQIRRRLPRRSPGRLLDVGCGLGLFLESMSAEFDLWGLDVSEYAIARCRQRLPAATFDCGSLSDGIRFSVKFDVVTAINVFEHLQDPARAADAVRSRMTTGGLLITHLPTIGNRLQRALYRGSYDQDPTHIYRPSGTAFTELISAAGFRCVASAYAPFVPMPVLRRVPAHPAFLAVFEAA
ncbi:class I SAM-dependent methyltransferase [Cumulibacter soli]|uniref:class I SAM-dependent methyltransferase n=1 Tax=Cumulibacter soli TaxID=2546344 RepID=UPI001419F268|nr:class I SAM-dependent methyltransferase [Cumulibacter soli]